MNTAMATDFLSKFDDSKRAVAKLMARENITVQIVTGAPTASFDTVRRVLTIPNWMSLTVDQFDMLMGHEVGHALFTDQTFIKDVVESRKTSRGLMTYFNIVEDAYIERKMKNSFPGLQRIFYNAYQSFHQNGPLFKGTKTTLLNPQTNQQVPIATMKLIDRINLFYKIGAFVTIPFSAEEKTFLAMIDKVTSTTDSMRVAKALHAFAKEQHEKDVQNPSNTPQPSKSSKTEPSKDQQEQQESQSDDTSKDDSTSDESGDDTSKDDADNAGDDASESSDDSTDSNSTDDASDETDADRDSDPSGDDDRDDSTDSTETDGDDSEQAADGSEGSDASDDDFDDASETADTTEEQLKDLAKSQQNSETLRNLLIAPLAQRIVNDRTVTAMDYTKLAESHLTGTAVTAGLQTIATEWNEKFLSTSKLMAQEFNRKKNATAMQRAQSARTGRLDMSKLHQYKYADDLFLRSVTMPNGQSHGIVMIIDASGSMSGVFGDVLDQTLLFAHFAHEAKIPFEAYMFTDSTRDGRYSYGETLPDASNGPLTLTVADSGRLVGLVNTVADPAAFKRQIRTVLALKSIYSGGRYARYNDDLTSDAYAVQSAARQIPYSGLNGTPLFTGVLLAEAHVARMKRTLRLDKMIFVCVTDGGDGNGLAFEDQTVTESGDIRTEMTSTAYGRLQGGVIVRDTVTKRNHILARPYTTGRGTAYTLTHNAWMGLLLDVIRERHNAKAIYLYLTSNGSSYRRRRSSRGPDVNSPYLYMTRTENVCAPVNAAETCKEEGQFVIPAKDALTDLCIIIPTSSVHLTEDEFEKLDATNMSQRKVAAEFEKSMNGRVSNRKFVNTIMPFIA